MGHCYDLSTNGGKVLVQIPLDLQPGGAFRVKVPIPAVAPSSAAPLAASIIDITDGGPASRMGNLAVGMRL
jgi:hypothetical protein